MPVKTLPHMGRTLSHLLAEREMSQGALAGKLRVTRQQVSYLCKARYWHGKTVERICAALDAPVSVFFGPER